MSRRFHNHPSSTSSRVRLSLHTIFSHNLLHRSTPKNPSSSAMSSPTVSSSSSSVRPSPSASYSSFRSPIRELNTNASPVFGTSYESSPTSYNYIRRQPSAIDLALEAEKYADHAELLGLGLLEPRPRANTTSTTSSSQCSMIEFMQETMQTPVVLDGIFEVLERA
ncbi:hypothetical protein A1O3_01216 [Capronia epimyces CBS 606.96]|uniref:Uncharacterized protein n=1 Tax=Capronia epimyces CBS 606.96 TaxID=1182542 RepID=W9ZDR3_9EURO|nr:uncharacterized protein A1O3_01216 [Capronia epimyces CBS 606.96]EXJ92664.1 hypothetical protein A1O3_01216 [Capronia epimyces CBS 606.96]